MTDFDDDIVQFLKESLAQGAVEDVQGDLSPEGHAAVAVRLYESLAPLLEMRVEEPAGTADFAIGMISEIADGHALATREGEPSPQEMPLIPTAASINRAIRDLGVREWLEDLGTASPARPAPTFPAPSPAARIPEHVATEQADQLVDRLARAAVAYRDGLAARDTPDGQARLQSRRMRLAAAEQLLVARWISAQAVSALGEESQLVAASLVHLSRGLFLLAWGGAPSPSRAFLQRLLSDDGSLAVLTASNIAIPAWLTSS